MVIFSMANLGVYPGKIGDFPWLFTCIYQEKIVGVYPGKNGDFPWLFTCIYQENCDFP